MRRQDARIAAAEVGARVRELRLAAGLTQAELAGGRFSKEYVSQIERGTTRPSDDALAWLAQRLDVDPEFLAGGAPSDHRARAEMSLARADALVDSNRYTEALDELGSLTTVVSVVESADLKLRALSTEARARVYLGEVNEAAELLTRARALAERPQFGDLERAEIVFQLGVCRAKLESTSTAVALFDEALRLAESCPVPSDGLRAKILYWRSRAYRQQRDYVAARDDADRALELARAASDDRTMAHSYFQASIVAERQGHWVQARAYAERARIKYDELADKESLARLLNNLGGLSYLLGRPAVAVDYLKESIRVALELDSEAEAGQAIGSLAQVHLGRGEYDLAAEQASRALALLGARVDFRQEVGYARLVLGRALMGQGRLDEAEEELRLAESTFEQLSLVSHRANVWMARGELAARRDDYVEATRLYSRAAESLQEFRF